MFALGLLVGYPSMAQTTNATDPTTTTPATEYQGVTIETPAQAPSPVQLWWKSIKEDMSLIFTMDPNKKSELAMKFAEERMRIAEKFLSSTNEKQKAKAEKSLERAKIFMEKMSQQAEKALKKPNDKTKELLDNKKVFLEHQADLMNNLEQSAGPKQIERVVEMREKLEKESTRLQQAISNEKLPEDGRAQLKEIQTRIEDHQEAVKTRIEDMKELKKAEKEGDETAKEKLEALKETWKKQQEALKKAWEKDKEQLEKSKEETDKKEELNKEAEKETKQTKEQGTEENE